MAEKKECEIEEKTIGLLVKELGYLPEEADLMQRLLKGTRDMLHFYLNEFGLHLEKDQQEELSKLSSKSDVLVLKISRLSFELHSLESEAKKSIEAKRDFKIDKAKATELAKEVSENKTDLLELNRRVTAIVEKMKELPREE